jgi:hypothetical protein
MAEIISITVLPQTNGQYVCQMSSSLNDSDGLEIQCHGQTKDHAIANALERLADVYRQRAEEQQDPDWNTVKQSESGKPIPNHYHVVLHYERIAEDVSKFEAMHNTIMGNTVVENAKISVFKIDADLPIEPLERSMF